MIDVAAAEDVTDGGTLAVDVDGTPVCIVNVGGSMHAVHDVCTHALERLSGGYVEGDRIECPRHGTFFSLVSGEALTPPATSPLPIFRCEVAAGRVLVDPTPSHPHPIWRGA